MNKILIVDDSRMNIRIVKDILCNDYELYSAQSGEEAIEFLKSKEIDLVLLDIIMPGLDGIQTLNIIKTIPECKNISVVFLTADNEENREIECLQLGATDFIRKPFVREVMKARVDRIIELENYKKGLEAQIEKKTNQINEMQKKIIVSFADLIETRDGQTGIHVKRTSEYVNIILDEVRRQGLYEDMMTEDYIMEVQNAAPLHDIGKIAIPDRILLKPGRLTPDEFEVIKTHTTIGRHILKECMGGLEQEHYLEVAMDLTMYHHEKWSGGGYPEGIKGEQIPVCARIMAVADVFDALISKRVYKEPMSYDEAFDTIKNLSGIQFQPELVEVFLSLRTKIISYGFK